MPKRGGQNPDTTTGLIVSEEIIAEARLVEGIRVEKHAKTAADKMKSETKRVHKRKARTAALKTTRQAILSRQGSHTMDWSKLVGRGGLTTVFELRLALHKLCGSSKVGKGVKGEALVTLFRAKFEEMDQPDEE